MTKIWFRWNRKNLNSIASLMPLLPGAELTEKPRPGIMLYSFASFQAEEVYREVSSSAVDATFIAGGPHPSARPEEVLRYFDYVVVGEGEETLPRLIEALSRGGDAFAIPGVAYRKDGLTYFSGAREPVDLDCYPPFRPPLKAPVEISRGCPWGCAYCQTPRLFGRRMRHRSVPLITRFAAYHKDIRLTSPNSLAYGSDGVHPRLDRVEELLKSLSELDRPIYFGTFPSEVRPEFVTDRSLELITGYCANRTLSIGGQSGSPEVLKRVGRGHGVEEIKTACRLCLDHGLTPNVDLILCLPGETAEDQMKTLELAAWIIEQGGKVRAHYFTPLPGTPLEGSAPAPLTGEAEALLGRLALQGSLNGVWQPRDKIA
ncbi:MAG: TIGR04013 family B12-binding domain/radical SAM domain-containing protein [Methanosarcinales archaeon]|nr:TIGR04013 family B12-binding domain/radical SAM domain-containing protein [Methanosarcinales archaeon]